MLPAAGRLRSDLSILRSICFSRKRFVLHSRTIQEPVTAGRSLPVGHLKYSSCVGAEVAKAVPLRAQCAQRGVRNVRADEEVILYAGWTKS